MKEYTIFFELFGKKMKTTIHALSEERAKERLKEKIIFHKVEEVKKKSKGELIDEITKMFGDGSNGFTKGNPFK